MSAGIDLANAETRDASVRLSRSPSSSSSSNSSHHTSGQYRPHSRSLASASLIPPASSCSPLVTSSSSAAAATPSLGTISIGRQPPVLSQLPPPARSPSSRRRIRAASLGSPPSAGTLRRGSTSSQYSSPRLSPCVGGGKTVRKIVYDPVTREQAKHALQMNDSMVYLDGPQVYACQQCRTHLTSHDDIISKSFHGRRGRAYLFDQCVNITLGPAEDRRLITGLHSVCDIFCQRCHTLVGWTYKRAYEASQKYKEGKYIIEKINLYLEESGTYDVQPPAGERRDRWRQRSQSWGSEETVHPPHQQPHQQPPMVYEYGPS